MNGSHLVVPDLRATDGVSGGRSAVAASGRFGETATCGEVHK